MQIIIDRTVPLDDLLTVETLRGHTFTMEQSGHVFDIVQPKRPYRFNWPTVRTQPW